MESTHLSYLRLQVDIWLPSVRRRISSYDTPSLQLNSTLKGGILYGRYRELMTHALQAMGSSYTFTIQEMRDIVHNCKTNNTPYSWAS